MPMGFDIAIHFGELSRGTAGEPGSAGAESCWVTFGGSQKMPAGLPGLGQAPRYVPPSYAHPCVVHGRWAALAPLFSAYLLWSSLRRERAGVADAIGKTGQTRPNKTNHNKTTRTWQFLSRPIPRVTTRNPTNNKSTPPRLTDQLTT